MASSPRPPAMHMEISTLEPHHRRETTRFRWRRVCRSATKDTFLLGLEALADSADAFPPLKSAVCGLLFIVKQANMVTTNAQQVTDVYAQIDSMAASLVRAIPDATQLSPTTEVAIRALDEDVRALCADVESIRRQRSPSRFIRARQHASQLDKLSKRLAQADASFTICMLTSTETKTTQILGHS
ncbi:unnamed protein product [Peniophora sp. CBMAI 1063]|nr:unnamed protein product [Peniophora sp. CBMAI 1063]